MKIDPYHNKEKWLKWKEKSKSVINGISQNNSSLIIKYLQDMELGINTGIGSKKGSRSHTRLNTLKTRIVLLTKQFEKRYGVEDITKLTEQQVCKFFADMRNGEIKRENGKNYKSVRDFVKDLKALWHWHQKISKKEGKVIDDITLYLDSSGDKPEWVYLNEDQVRAFYDNAKPKYKPLIMFLFDSGIRSPTELVNVKVSDLLHDCKELNIREETSKTFGRRIKLMLCSQLLKEHIKSNNLGPDDYLFKICPRVVNRYFKRLARRLFGDEKSPAGQKYSEITMYDFRHISCCYWLPRYKSESALKFRFGWKKSDKIHYYSEMLGMRDTISEEDLLIDVTKTELEKRLTKAEHENQFIKEEMDAIKEQNKEMRELVNRAILMAQKGQIKELVLETHI